MIRGMEHLSCQDRLSWGCSVWRKEGSGEMLLQSFNIYRRPARKMVINFLAGPERGSFSLDIRKTFF